MEKPFLHVIKDELGDKYNKNVQIIYEKVIKFILNLLVEGFADGNRLMKRDAKTHMMKWETSGLRRSSMVSVGY